MTHRFTVGHSQLDGHRYWLNVAVHGTADEMRAAAHKHRPHPDPENWDAMGCFTAGDRTNDRYLGIMRLCREHLTVPIVVHESVHAALVYVHKAHSCAHSVSLNAWSNSPGVVDREEALAYAAHGISTALLTAFGLLA